MIADKNAITIRAISKRDELEALLTDVKVGVGVNVGVEDDGAGVGLKGMLAGTLIVCALLQALVTPSNSYGAPKRVPLRPICPIIACTWTSV